MRPVLAEASLIIKDFLTLQPHTPVTPTMHATICTAPQSTAIPCAALSRFLAPPLPASAQPDSSSAAVLAVISAEEFRIFFPNGLTSDGCPVPLLIPASSEALTAACLQWKPQVLVTSWSTPGIPAAATVVQGGPVRYVCNVTGSVRHIVDRDLIAAGLQVSNWGTLPAAQVAEHALLLTLGALRSLPKWNHLMRHGQLSDRPELHTRTLFGKAIGLHGFGAVARELIKLLAPFGVSIEVFSHGVPPDVIRQAGVKVAPSLLALAQDKPVFIDCEALTADTRLSVNRDVLAALADGAVFCNVGRGAVVDEVALADLANAKQLRIASDVFTHEPLSLDSPLFANERALLSPHIAGPTHDQYPACGDYAQENIERFRQQLPLLSLITPEIFDRST